MKMSLHKMELNWFLLSETVCLLRGAVWVLKYDSSYDWSFPPVLLAVGLNTAVTVRSSGRSLGNFQAVVLRISVNTGIGNLWYFHTGFGI